MQKAFVPPEMLTMIEMETFLCKNIYLSGTENPGQIDSKMIDHFQFNKIFPDKSQYPNCFSWYWSLVVFSPETRALWNPLHINPEISDIDSENEPEEDSKKTVHSLSKSTQNQHDNYEIDYNGVDFLNDMNDDDFANQFDGSFRMSHISNDKSHSTNSNIQYCQDIVNGLENVKSTKNISDISKNMINTEEKPFLASEDKLTQKQFFPSLDLNTKNQPNPKVQIIKSRIIPKNTSNQLKICELIMNSFEMTIQPKSEANPKLDSSKQLSEDSTQIIRPKSNSHNNQNPKNDQVIDIKNNYSFFHEIDTANGDNNLSLNIKNQNENTCKQDESDINKIIANSNELEKNSENEINGTNQIINIKSFCFSELKHKDQCPGAESLDKGELNGIIKDSKNNEILNEKNKLNKEPG